MSSDAALGERIVSALSVFLDDRRSALPEAAPLLSEIQRLVDAGGKRLRPRFCYWGHRVAGGADGPEIVRTAASLELLHTFAIIHDDIMDNADRRRGQPTIHSIHGPSIAVLAGDLALVLADTLLTTAGWPPSGLEGGLVPYARMRQEVIAGQYLDIVRSGDPDMSEEDARRIVVLKSGRYTVLEPLLIGASLAGEANELGEFLVAFGEPLGEAFQLTDDLLGTFGPPTQTGKPDDSDIREGKRNLLYARAAQRLSGEERDFFIHHWGAGPSLSDAEVARLRELVESSGTRASVEELRDRLASQALEALASTPGRAESKAHLEALANEACGRAVS